MGKKWRGKNCWKKLLCSSSCGLFAVEGTSLLCASFFRAKSVGWGLSLLLGGEGSLHSVRRKKKACKQV